MLQKFFRQCADATFRGACCQKGCCTRQGKQLNEKAAKHGPKASADLVLTEKLQMPMYSARKELPRLEKESQDLQLKLQEAQKKKEARYSR